MRILLCLNRDIMSNLALNLLRPALKDHIVYIFLSDGVGHAAKQLEEITLLEKTIPCDIIFPLCEAQEALGSYYSFNQCEYYESMPIFTPENVNAPETIRQIKKFSPDLILSIRYGQIFQQEVIDIPAFGVINLHSGLLPDYRGVLVTLQALLRDEKHIGTTLHYITDPTIDTGPIIDQSFLEVKPGRSLFWHVAELYQGGTALVEKALAEIMVGHKPKAIAQNKEKGRYYSLPTLEEVEALKKKGFPVCDGKSYKELMRHYVVG